MVATVKFLGFPEPQITLPATAIVQSGESSFLFEQMQPWILQPVKVVAGAQVGGATIVTDGLDNPLVSY
jgi:hypothetical protein